MSGGARPRDFDSRNVKIYKMADRGGLSSMARFLAVFCVFNCASAFEFRNMQSWMPVQGPRRLFGGYRITPQHCRPARSLSPSESGSTICMFNHECTVRKGQVVGPCMDGFLFGACCLIRDGTRLDTSPDDSIAVQETDNRLPQHPSRTTEREPEQEVRTTADEEVPPKIAFTTEKLSTSDLISQIASTLLNEPPKDIDADNQVFNYSTIKHELPDTVIVHHNDNNPVNDILISKPQTKPPMGTTVNTPTVPEQSQSTTHKPLYQKPAFKPKKPVTTSTMQSYILVETVTKPSANVQEMSSIESIVHMLNITSSHFMSSTTMMTPVSPDIENRHTTIEIPSSSISPVLYASGYPPLNVFSSTYPSKLQSTSVQVTTSKPSTPSTYVYQKHPSSTPIIVKKTTLTTKRPPSTSYVYSPTPTRRPVSSLPNDIGPPYNVPGSPDTFSSVTPTVIVLAPPSPNPVTYSATSQDNFIEIPQEPLKKPVHQVTINNIIQSTNNIHLGPQKRPPQQNIEEQVVITPKPSITTQQYADSLLTTPPVTTTLYVQSTNQLPEISGSPTYSASYSAVPVVAEEDPTTNKYQYNQDELINFPPVRNPYLNGTGSNINMFNSSVDLGNDDEILQEVEFTTPSFLQEDIDLDNKMSVFVSKIVGSLQGTFQELHDIVMLDKKPNATIIQPNSATTVKPPIRRPAVTTKKPFRATSTTTTKKPFRKPALTTKRPITTIQTTIQPVTTKKPAKATAKPKPVKKVTTTTIATTTIIDEISDDIGQETGAPEARILCGVRPLMKSGRIVGGKGAMFGEWPWQVLVRESTWLGLFTKNKCGGVLITTKYVTTAAHCQPGFLASLVAVFGEHDISGDHEPKRTVSRNVRRVVVHRLYDAATFENDLALLELESPIHYDSHIVPICMPPDSSDFTGRMATVTGWGRLEYTGGVPAILQEVKVPVIENSVCQEMFQTAGHSKIILNSFICAGYANGQKDSCEGDSGGPLVTERPDGRWQLVGTVSHGIKCAAPYLPGVYMRTTYYKPWLKSITGVQ